MEAVSCGTLEARHGESFKVDQGVALPDAGEKSEDEGMKPASTGMPSRPIQQQPQAHGLPPKPITGQ